MEEYSNKNCINEAIGKSIKKYRKKKHLTQEKMSELIDVSTNYMNILENGKSGMSFETMLKITKICDITPNELLQEFIPDYKNRAATDMLKQKIMKLDLKEKNLVEKLIEAIEENKLK